MIKSSIKQHAAGLIGQVAAALPQLMISVYLARTDGLLMAGHFAVLTGIAAMTFTASLWGFRSYIVLEQLTRFSATTYAAARLFALIVATLVTFYVASLSQIPVILVASIVLLKCADSFIDLTFAINQVALGTNRAIDRYARQQVLKAIVLLLAVTALSYLATPPPPDVRVAAGSFAAIVLGTIETYRALMRRPLRPMLLGDLFALLKATSLFATSSIVCAAVTSTPRVALSRFHAGPEYGAVGAALTTATVFGMAFYTTWIRYLPRFAHRNSMRVRLAFAVETTLLSISLGIFSVTVFPEFVARLFGFDPMLAGDLIQWTLLAATCFYTGMTFANLYKVTDKQFMEVVTYVTTLTAMIACIVLLPRSLISLPELMAGAGVAMIALSVPALFCDGHFQSSEAD